MSRLRHGEVARRARAVGLSALLLLAPSFMSCVTAGRPDIAPDAGVPPPEISGSGSAAREAPPGEEDPGAAAAAGRGVAGPPQAPPSVESSSGRAPEAPAAIPAAEAPPAVPADAGPPAATAEEPPIPESGRAGDAVDAGAPEGADPPREAKAAAKARPQNGRPAKERAESPPGKREGGFSAVVARLPDGQAFAQDGPPWAREKEELVYRVETLGIAMGYARFAFHGKVLLDGREAYHLNVRAWTSDILSLIYPINETIDYYLDVKTLAPLRQESTKRDRSKDDVTIYDQEKGTIVSRYKRTGEIRKKVDAVPNVYDPVTVAYLFRAGDLSGLEKPRNLYSGRKLWEITATTLGFERIKTDAGEVDTVLVKPVIRKDGQVYKRGGDLKMWMTRDGRHVPMRVYAKFKKIRTWTLVGTLVPDRKGG